MPNESPSQATRFDEAGGWLWSIYVVEMGALAALIGLYQAASFRPLEIDAGPAALAIGGFLCLGLGFWRLAQRTVRRGIDRAFVLAMSANVLTVAAAFTLSEALLRTTAEHTEQGIRLGGLLLPPTWPEIVSLSERALSTDPRARYFVHDTSLGWVVGPSRLAASRGGTDRIYASSAEGIRAAEQGVRLSEAPSTRRVGLVGDSYTFGLEVPFEHTWGHHLDGMLDDGVQVLNFGVDGYGLDQMLLRYRRDVVEWEPDVVVLTFVPHDLERTMVVYPMIALGWYGYLVKPRFTLEDGSLRLLERSLPSPNRILAARTPEQLPLIEWDPGYAEADWWFRTPGTPMLLRFLTALSPRPSSSTEMTTAETKAELNAAIINEFVASVVQEGSEPMVVFLPARAPYTHPEVARLTLEMVDTPVVDLTECVLQVPSRSRRINGGHYTNRTNQAIATCLSDPIAAALESRQERSRSVQRAP